MRLSLAIGAAVGMLLAAAVPVASTLAAGEEPSPELDRFYLRLAGGQREVARMSGCLVNQHPEEARQMFDHEPGTAEYQQASQRFYEHAAVCLFTARELRGTNLMFLGGIAEQLIDMDKPARAARTARPGGPSLQPGGGSHLWTWRNLTDTAANRSLPLSYCLLERHGDQVEAVLAARPTSGGERKVFNALNDEIDGCIPAGETWTLQPQILRSALAIAYYRSARAAANTSNGAAG